MTHLRINLRGLKPVIVNLIAGSLQIGQVLVLPTDTVYGLSCLATSPRAIKKIYRLKKRDQKNPVLILVSSLEMARQYVYISKKQAEILNQAWQKGTRPTTFILKSRHLLPKELALNSNSLALRLPKSKFLIKIIERVACPLVSTSLNLQGQTLITDLLKLPDYFPKKNNQPDLVIDRGPLKRLKPSRIVDLRRPDKPLIVRP